MQELLFVTPYIVDPCVWKGHGLCCTADGYQLTAPHVQ